MYLRTLVGAHAGEVREYSYEAASAALAAGFAEPTGTLPASLVHLGKPRSVQPDGADQRTTSKRKASRR